MYVKVKVTPAAKRESVTKESDTVFRMEVREPAERNLANERVKQLLRDALGITEGEVRLIAGHRSGNKVFDVINKITK